MLASGCLHRPPGCLNREGTQSSHKADPIMLKNICPSIFVLITSLWYKQVAKFCLRHCLALSLAVKRVQRAGGQQSKQGKSREVLENTVEVFVLLES